MLFGGGRALNGSVSMRHIGDGYRAYIAIAKYKDK